MAISKIILNGVTQMDLTQDTVATNNLLQSYTAHGADGLSITGTATAGIDIPVFTFRFDSNYNILSASCNKTFAQCYARKTDEYSNAALYQATYDVDTDPWADEHSLVIRSANSNQIVYTLFYEAFPAVDITYSSNGQIDYTSSSSANLTLNVTSNGDYYPSNGVYTEVHVSVSSGSPTIQSLNITPSETAQTFNASGVDGYKPVTVDAISSTYIGSGIARKSSTDLTASGATVTAPAGYYAEAASKSVSSMTLPTAAASSATSGYTSKATIGRSTAAQYINIPPGYNSTGAYYVISAVANGSATAPASISGTAASISTGTNTLTLTKTISVTPTVSAGYVSSGTAGNSSVSLTASVTTKAAATITPTTTNQTIAAGTYLTGTQTIAGDADLVASNIVSGVQIFGVTGNVVLQNYYTGSSAPSSSTGSNGDLYLQT